jgi:uncharacterized protein (DUF433 family)
MKYGEISIDPEVMSGAAVFAGTRVLVQTLFDYIEGGDDLAEFLDDFPSVSKESALALPIPKRLAAAKATPTKAPFQFSSTIWLYACSNKT